MILIQIIWGVGMVTFFCLFFYILKQLILKASIKKVLAISIFISFFGFVCLNRTAFLTTWYVANILFTGMLLFLSVYSISSLYKRKQIAPEIAHPLLSVSVIIVMHNEELVIRKTVENLIKLNYKKERFEIIIVDDNSTDNSIRALDGLESQIRIVCETNPDSKGKPRAINRLVHQLTSDLICIFDADSLPEENFLEKMIPYFNNDKTALVQGRNIQYNEQNTIIAKLSSIDIDATHFTLINGKNAIKGMCIFEGRGAILRRSIFIKLGGFECDLPTEDWDYGFRCQIAGYCVFYNPEAKNWEQSVENVEDFYHQRYRWLSTTILTFTKNFNDAMRSSSLSKLQKIDFFLPLAIACWSINLNLLGVLSLINNHTAYVISTNYYILFFIIMQFFYLFPALVKRKKILDIFYIPLMFLYYWGLSFIISFFIQEHYLLKQKLNLRKAPHYKSSLEAFKLKKNTN
ncbi:MAG TPA: glycosyltransferase [Bacteroidia bacterium]|nr:glycosyltransferase [Bacteroidia bacterium]